MKERLTIPARCGRAAFVYQGQRVRVINTHGGGGYWAFICWNLCLPPVPPYDRASAIRIKHLADFRTQVG